MTDVGVIAIGTTSLNDELRRERENQRKEMKDVSGVKRVVVVRESRRAFRPFLS